MTDLLAFIEARELDVGAVERCRSGRTYQEAIARLAALGPSVPLARALWDAQRWLDELREEFRRGALEDRACRGGYLSNKNVEVEVQARVTLAAWAQAGEERGKVG